MAVIITRLLRTQLSREFQYLRSCTYSSQQKVSTQAKPIVNPPETEASKLIEPLKCPDLFAVYNLFTVKDLFDAKVHLGHREGTLNDNMRPFLYGSRLGYLIFDLDQTAVHLRSALNFAAHIAYKDGIILFIARHPQCTQLVDETAMACGEFSHTREWSLGTFTDSTNYYGSFTRLPDLCIFLNTFQTVMEQHLAVKEAAKMNIPTIGVIDTNVNPNLITFPIPGNDDSVSAIELYCRLFQQAILRGKQARKQMLDNVKKQLAERKQAK